jgi:ABC-2 type transport system ATP-binding protein
MDEIVFDNVNKGFKFGLKENIALKDVSLEIKQGEIFGFVGPNGAGKSTSINIALDFVKPDSGSVLIKNIPSTDAKSRSRLGYMPENPHLSNHLTPGELLEFGGRVSGVDKHGLHGRIEVTLEKLKLDHVIDRPIKTFSKGMKQRVALAMATIHNPEILILDEPMSGLDPMGRKLVSDLISELKEQGKTIFFSTHILNDVESLCDRIAVIHKGTILFTGNMQDFQNTYPSLEEAFVASIAEFEDA